MARVAVVATSSVSREELGEHRAPEDELVVVVPAVEQSRLNWLTNDEGDARRRAEEVGESIALRAPGDTTTVDVKPDPPSQVVLDAIAEHRPDRLLLVVRRDEDATWLEAGQADAIRSQNVGVPVTLIEL
jgi:hypothetical protein